MSDAEILAFMAVRKGKHVCAFMLASPVVPHHPKRANGIRRWLLAVEALLSGQHVSVLGFAPQLPPVRISLLKQTTVCSTQKDLSSGP